MDEPRIRGYRDLDVWKKGIDLCESVYRVTERFPADERFGLTNQMRRASVSVPSNVAEGHCRAHTKEYIQFIHHSRGSLGEIDTQLEIARRLKFLPEPDAAQLFETVDHVQRMLSSLTRSLKSRL